ncbi:MAG: hypothetical protein K5873_12290 [Treponema sp.]|nr:hypothetical protein [Treponema sp.]
MKKLICIFLAFFSFFIFSCSDSEADVAIVTSSIIFDYYDNESLPSQRLAVFLQVTNDVQRTDSFTISHDKSGYSWNVVKPGIFRGMNKNYAYSANLSAPVGEYIPTGLYSVVYFDAAGSEDSVTFSVNYKEELKSSKASDCQQILGNSIENIAIYDDAEELLFMGKAKSNWKTNANILKDYKLASTKRICYVNPGNTVICMMPAENLREEE